MTELIRPKKLPPADLPLLEYDPTQPAIIEPRNLIAPLAGFTHCVLCYFREVIAELVTSGDLVQVAEHGSEMGTLPLYALDHHGSRIGVIQAPVGAPFAAAILEELIARGMHNFLVCGSCGVLDRSITVGHLLLPVSALRDEGTSYHYLPASREVLANKQAVQSVQRVLDEHGYAYHLVKTWTTDAFYRETPAKVALRRSEGCLVVEMEAAAFMAVAQFRQVQLGMILYAGDDVSGNHWDARDWQGPTTQRGQVFRLAVEACLGL